MARKKEKRLQLTLKKSTNKRRQSHKDCVAGLGLRRIDHTVNVIDSPENRGMINKVSYLLLVERV